MIGELLLLSFAFFAFVVLVTGGLAPLNRVDEFLRALVEFLVIHVAPEDEIS